MNLRGPHCLGRSVVVSPEQPTPDEWSDARRVDAAAINAVIGRQPEAEQVVADLRRAWQRREALIIECPDLPAPAPLVIDHFWDLDPATEPHLEQLDFYLFANAVDLRSTDLPRFAPWDLAKRSGAKRSTNADIVTPSGEHCWIDGGPLQVIEHADLSGYGIIPRLHLQQNRFQTLHPSTIASPSLAPDQIAAVQHNSGPARIIAPAGSGKTRVLTERVRHLVAQGVATSVITLVAYNVRAQQEIRSRLTDVPGISVKTLHALAREVLGNRNEYGEVPDLVNELDTRKLLNHLIPPAKRRANTDPVEAWVDAVAFARDTLSSPSEVETTFPDISDFSRVIGNFRDELHDRNSIDFPEMVLLACEALLHDVSLRRSFRQRVGVLLVDEFQDLTPLLMLFVRLLAGPANEVFCVGDDDQTINGYSGATPEWLVDFQQYFPGAHQYALTINYRCPDDIVQAAVKMLANNVDRVDKQISCAPAQRDHAGLTLISSASPDNELLRLVTQQLDDGAAPRDIAVLARVNASLLGPYLFLSGSGIPCRRPVSANEDILSRGGVASLLAWVDIANSAKRPLDPGSLALALKRPRRSVSPGILQIISSKSDLASIGSFVASNKNPKMRDDLVDFVAHAQRLQGLVKNKATTLDIIDDILDTVGLAESLDDLDNSQRVARKATHRDELESFRSVAILESNPAKFIAFVHDVLAHGSDIAEGVTLETVHRVKGQEWPHVHVVGAVDGQIPHRLSLDVEEERRIFHVAITRCSKTSTVYRDLNETPSPFIAELTGQSAAIKTTRTVPSQNVQQPPSKKSPKVDEITEYDTALFDALRAWRHEVARLTSKPAFTVFGDATLKELAAFKPRSASGLSKIKGIGPAKLDQYSLVLLEIIDRFS